MLYIFWVLLWCQCIGDSKQNPFYTLTFLNSLCVKNYNSKVKPDGLSRVDSTFLSDEIAIDLWQMPVKAGRDCFVAVRWELKVGRFCYQSFVVGVRQWQAAIIDLIALSDLSSSGHRRSWQCSSAENWHEKEVTWLLRGQVVWFKGVCLSKHFINQNFQTERQFIGSIQFWG